MGAVGVAEKVEKARTVSGAEPFTEAELCLRELGERWSREHEALGDARLAIYELVFRADVDMNLGALDRSVRRFSQGVRRIRRLQREQRRARGNLGRE